MAPLRSLLLIALLAQLSGVTSLPAQDPSVPAELQVALFAKILSFDRSLPARSGSVIDVLVLYQTDNTTSREAGQAFVAAFTKSPVLISGRTVKVTSIAIDKTFDVAAAMQSHDPDVVYIAPMRALNMPNFIRAVADYGSVAITPVREYVQKGAAIGVELQGGRPHILVNLPAARRQRMDLSAQLLKLAELVGR